MQSMVVRLLSLCIEVLPDETTSEEKWQESAVPVLFKKNLKKHYTH